MGVARAPRYAPMAEVARASGVSKGATRGERVVRAEASNPIVRGTLRRGELGVSGLCRNRNPIALSGPTPRRGVSKGATRGERVVWAEASNPIAPSAPTLRRGVSKGATRGERVVWAEASNPIALSGPTPRRGVSKGATRGERVVWAEASNPIALSGPTPRRGVSKGATRGERVVWDEASNPIALSGPTLRRGVSKGATRGERVVRLGIGGIWSGCVGSIRLNGCLSGKTPSVSLPRRLAWLRLRSWPGCSRSRRRGRGGPTSCPGRSGARGRL